MRDDQPVTPSIQVIKKGRDEMDEAYIDEAAQLVAYRRVGERAALERVLARSNELMRKWRSMSPDEQQADITRVRNQAEKLRGPNT